MSTRAWLLCALLLGACSPDPTLVLGRLPDAALDDDADSDEDASTSEPCDDDQGDGEDCNSRERPYCDRELKRCVACLTDRHCRDGQYCSQRGRCNDER